MHAKPWISNALRRLQLLLVLFVLLLLNAVLPGCAALSKSSTPPPVAVDCPAPPPVPPSLRLNATPPSGQETYSERALRNINEWQKKLTQ